MAELARDLIPYFTICNEETVSMSNRVVCSFIVRIFYHRNVISVYGYITIACRIEYADAALTTFDDTKCNTFLLYNIVLINRNYKPEYYNCFKVD